MSWTKPRARNFLRTGFIIHTVLSRTHGICTMRFLLLTLMLALLPLRGWAGDAMAVASLAPPAQYGAMVVTADCHELHAGHDMALTLQDGTHAEEGHGPQCGDCQICHSVALASPVVPLLLQKIVGRLPQRALHAPTSAEPVQGFKPPIA